MQKRGFVDRLTISQTGKNRKKVIFRFDNIDPHVCKKVLASMSMKHFNLENIIP